MQWWECLCSVAANLALNNYCQALCIAQVSVLLIPISSPQDPSQCTVLVKSKCKVSRNLILHSQFLKIWGIEAWVKFRGVRPFLRNYRGLSRNFWDKVRDWSLENKGLLSWYSDFLLPSETNTAKFHFDLGMLIGYMKGVSLWMCPGKTLLFYCR